MNVYVLTKTKEPLMPCHPARARYLLKTGKAKVYRQMPFTIILTHREVGTLQPLECKIDPGSKTTGIALVVQGKNNTKVIWGAHLKHRGDLIKKALLKRKAVRNSRRFRLTRYRPPRFLNRVRPQGWLAPSLLSRINNIYNWVRKFKLWAPLSSIELEHAKFDIQKLENPDIKAIDYQQGTLLGYEIRQYLLEKWGRKCAYCNKKNVPFEIDHLVPKSKGGTNRVSNLVLACKSCNTKKGNRDVDDFIKDRKCLDHIKAQLKQSYKDAGIMNAMRNALVSSLKTFNCGIAPGGSEARTSAIVRNTPNLPVHCWTGALTKTNRINQNLAKLHWIDAACVGISGQKLFIPRKFNTLTITAFGRGSRQKCKMNKYGFPISQPKKAKRVHGFQSGDFVKVVNPPSVAKKKGKWSLLLNQLGRVTIRTTGNFDFTSFRRGKKASISFRCCKLVQRFDGYSYTYNNGLQAAAREANCADRAPSA